MSAPVTARRPALRADLPGSRITQRQLNYVLFLARACGWSDSQLDTACAGWAARFRHHVGPPEELSQAEASLFITWLQEA